MKKIVKYEIEYCNTRCPNFFHNFDDRENIFCVKLGKKIFDFDIKDNVFMDLTERPIPKECQLLDAEE